MSLINDALKRADRDQQTRFPAGAAGTLQPVHYQRRESLLLPLVFVLIVALAITGSVLIWKALAGNTPVQARQSEPTEVPAANPSPHPAQPAPVEEQSPVAAVPAKEVGAEKPAEAPAPAVETPTASAAETPDPETATGASSPKAQEQIAAQETAAPKPEPEPSFSDLTLDGIVYHPKRPCVMVHGKSIFIGESVYGATLIAVEPNSATFEIDGQQKQLFMP